MTTAALTITVAVALLAGGCTALLLRSRKRRLAGAADGLLQPRPPSEPSLLLAFPPPPAAATAAAQELARVSGLTLMEAEDLLDWLEQNGYAERGLVCESEKSFAVEFRVDAAHTQAPKPHPGQVRRFSAG